MNIVLDTNVLVSALYTSNSESPTVKIIELVLCGKLTLLCNDDILEEYEDVLKRPKFKFPETVVNNLLNHIRRIAINTERTPCDDVFNDLDDKVFYEVALSVDNTYLTTGNIKHFPKSPFVVTPTKLLEIFNSKELS